MSDQELLNIEANAADLNIPPDIYLRILKKAIEQTSQDITAFELALSGSDYDALQTISHRWKGDYDNLRVHQLAAIAKDMNESTKGKTDIDAISTRFAEFKNIYAQLTETVSNT